MVYGAPEGVRKVVEGVPEEVSVVVDGALEGVRVMVEEASSLDLPFLPFRCDS